MEIVLLFLVSFFIAALLSIAFIKLARKRQYGQSIREDGPEAHLNKAGTPTMGGIVFLVALLVVTLGYIDLTPNILLLLFVTMGSGFIGFLDDFIIVVMKRNLGLTSKQKILGQTIITGLFMYFLYQQGISTAVEIPGTSTSIELSWFYFVFIFFLIIGSSNATNLTDGMDGLLGGTAFMAIAAFGSIAFELGNQQIGLFSIVFTGAIFGFLLFNKYPAKMFMGDAGSLAIGSAIAGMAIILKLELLLAVIGGIFIIETLSVMIQVTSFKLRNKLVFKMSPLHHHFEVKGYNETTIVEAFYIVGIILAFFGVALFQMSL